MDTKVTVGLCLKNAATNVKTAFHSISIQDYPHNLIKIVIVVDGNEDSTLALALKFAQETDARALVKFNQNKGLGAARQAVVDNAEGNYIIWIDDDFVLNKNFITNHVNFMEKNPNVGAACPKVLPTYKTTVAMLETIDFLLPNPKPTFVGTGGSIFRLQAIKEVQGFDVKVKGAGEDWDISHRIAEAGWTLASDDSAVFYRKYPPSTLPALWKKHSWYGYGNHLLCHKFQENRTLLLAYYPPYAALGSLKSFPKLYQSAHKKEVFLLPLYAFFVGAAENFGFIKAHAKGHGHS